MTHSVLKANVTIDRIHDLLGEGRAEEALVLVNQHEEPSDLWQNAKGACLLRLGLYERALQVLRGIVFPGGSIFVPEDVPALYRANFATAMLLTDHMDGAIAIAEHLVSDGHPYVSQVLQAVQRWKKSLTFLQRAALALGWYPEKPVQMDFPLGGI